MRLKTVAEIAGVVATVISVGVGAWYQDQENKRIEADDQIYARGDELFYAWSDAGNDYYEEKISKQEYLAQLRQLEGDLTEHLEVMDNHQWETNALPSRNLLADVLEYTRSEIETLETEYYLQDAVKILDHISASA